MKGGTGFGGWDIKAICIYQVSLTSACADCPQGSAGIPSDVLLLLVDLHLAHIFNDFLALLLQELHVHVEGMPTERIRGFVEVRECLLELADLSVIF